MVVSVVNEVCKVKQSELSRAESCQRTFHPHDPHLVTVMDLLNFVTLRFQSPILETSFSNAQNEQLRTYDIACSLAIPFIPITVLLRRCPSLLPTSVCRVLGHCRQGCPVEVHFSARPALNTALLVHALIYCLLVTTLLAAPHAWLTRHRVHLACAVRVWYIFVLPLMVLFQPTTPGGEYTCTYLQGVHLHTTLLTTAFVPLCHQVRPSRPC